MSNDRPSHPAPAFSRYIRPTRKKITPPPAHTLPPPSRPARTLDSVASLTLVATFLLLAALPAPAQVVQHFIPVTPDMLLNPAPGDWLMFSRTYDAQHFSPLAQINRSNVATLRLAWSRGMTPGQTESSPLVHDGVMYVINPGAIVQALDGATGDLIWEYKRKVPAATAAMARPKSLAIFQDVILYTAPDSYVVGLDARTGEQRWQTRADERGHTSGPLVINGKVITAGACAQGNLRANCYIAAHDALTGKEIWRFYTTQDDKDPAGDSWNGAPVANRLASTWALPGSYDPARNLLYWGIANPMPNTRMDRHAGNPDGTARSAPADLYSNSTVALNPDTGKLVWYYQHLPGDDWDMDINEERTLIRTAVSPDSKYVKWINPNIPRGEVHDISVNVGEGGGLWALDRSTGQFLWAMPFPYDTPNFILSNIDVKTGKTFINWDVVLKHPGDRHVICYFNTRSYWPTSYNPEKNALYVPYFDNCLDMTAAVPAGTPGQAEAKERRFGVARPGSDPNALVGLAKVNMSTGEIQRFSTGSRATSTGAALATAGDLVFWGDLNRRLRAFDADSGKILWEQIVGGTVSSSVISYAVNGKQYLCVMTGDNLAVPGLLGDNDFAGVKPEFKVPRGHNAIYVFTLP